MLSVAPLTFRDGLFGGFNCLLKFLVTVDWGFTRPTNSLQCVNFTMKLIDVGQVFLSLVMMIGARGGFEFLV